MKIPKIMLATDSRPRSHLRNPARDEPQTDNRRRVAPPLRHPAEAHQVVLAGAEANKKQGKLANMHFCAQTPSRRPTFRAPWVR